MLKIAICLILHLRKVFHIRRSSQTQATGGMKYGLGCRTHDKPVRRNPERSQSASGPPDPHPPRTAWQ